MAGTPDAVARLLVVRMGTGQGPRGRGRDALRHWPKRRATHAIEPWDWRYYAEKVRKARYHLDDSVLKPYFSLERMLAAAFDTAHRLFGISFVLRPDIATYHPDVRVFEVRGADDKLIGIFLSDNYARPNKRGGAWMNAYRWQSRTAGETLPIVVNNNNFAKGPSGTPTLCRRTMCARCSTSSGTGCTALVAGDLRAPSGTHVLRDFVELPSQLFGTGRSARDPAASRAASCDRQADPR
jgi:peptidyl-dipeptidase Dcp